MSIATLEKKYNSLSCELQNSLDLYLDFLISKMPQKTLDISKRKEIDFSIYNTNSKIWDEPQEFISELRNERF